MTAATPRPTDPGDPPSPFEGIDTAYPSPAGSPGDQPDPVTLCEPSYDGDGLLRWASVTFDVTR